MALQPDGKILLCGDTYNSTDSIDEMTLFRFNSNGTLDNTFATGGIFKHYEIYGALRALSVLTSGQIMLGGFASGTKGNDWITLRLTAGGQLDSTFGGGDGIVTQDFGTDDLLWGITPLANGQYLEVGYSSATTIGSTVVGKVARYNSDGSIDSAFGGPSGVDIAITTAPNTYNYLYSAQVMADGRIVVGGYTGFARLNADGSLDSTFNGTGKLAMTESRSSFGGFRVLPSGKIVQAYQYMDANYRGHVKVVRWNADGTADTSFNNTGYLLTDFGASTNDELLHSTQIDAQGRIVIGGDRDQPDGDFMVARFVESGASISGRLWNDVDADGIVDTGEAALPSRTVYIDANNNGAPDSGEASKLTDSSGNFSFTALAAGTYVLRQVLPAGWTQTYPTSNTAQSVILTTGQAVTGKNFGSRTTTTVTAGSIAGYLWSDTNGNGVKDGTESFTTSREVFIDANKNGTKDTGEVSVFSDASGNFKFVNLAPGAYRIRRTPLPVGYRYSSPQVGYYDVTVTSGLIVTGKNIGVTDLALVSGTVFNDANANKLKDAGEAGVSGWKVFIDANNNGVLDSTEKYATTDASGNFSLSLAAGTYNLRLQGKAGYTITAPSTGAASITLAKAQLKSGILFGTKAI